MRRALKSFALALLLGAAIAEGAEIRVGMPLRDALVRLQQMGLPLVFSTRVVRAELLVITQPRSDQPRRVLRELLEPHSLTVIEGPKGVLIVVRSPAPDAPPISVSEEIVVQPSRISLLSDEPAAPLTLTRDDIRELPHLGNDVFRTLGLMPGTASNDLSAQFHLRGGRRDEVLILLDGQELYEPYHLTDFDNALGIVDVSALARINLMSAAFPVSYGDRMTGVLEMVTATPPAERRLRLGATMIGTTLDAGATHGDAAISWMASLRSGTTDFVGRLFDLDEATFWDAFGKVEVQLSTSQTLTGRGLFSVDTLDTTSRDELDGQEEPAQIDSEYDTSYLWLTHRSFPTDQVLIETTASTTQTHRDRTGSSTEPLHTVSIDDERRLDVIALVQSWHVQPAPRHLVNLGAEFQKYDAFYDYSRDSTGALSFRDDVASEHLSVWVSDHVRAAAGLTLELGLRYDRHTAVDDNILSPRLNAAWMVAPNTVLRLGWGYFSQSQRAYELMVEDGDPRFYRAERSQHSVIGLEREFGSRSPVGSFRLEAYRRKVADPRPRYENLVRPFDRFREARFDRVRIEPESATAEGLEMMIRGRAGRRTGWWLNYAFAFAEDRIDGRDVLRSIDQKHAINLDVNHRLTPDWTVNVAWQYRSGRPITPLLLEGSQPVFGAINSARLPNYHRMDMRLAREWRFGAGDLALFVDGHNLYSQKNVSGFGLRVDETTSQVFVHEETWPRFFATAGVSWEFH